MSKGDFDKLKNYLQKLRRPGGFNSTYPTVWI